MQPGRWDTVWAEYFFMTHWKRQLFHSQLMLYLSYKGLNVLHKYWTVKETIPLRGWEKRNSGRFEETPLCSELRGQSLFSSDSPVVPKLCYITSFPPAKTNLSMPEREASMSQTVRLKLPEGVGGSKSWKKSKSSGTRSLISREIAIGLKGESLFSLFCSPLLPFFSSSSWCQGSTIRSPYFTSTFHFHKFKQTSCLTDEVNVGRGTIRGCVGMQMWWLCSLPHWCLTGGKHLLASWRQKQPTREVDSKVLITSSRLHR